MVKLNESDAPPRRKNGLGWVTPLRACIASTMLLVCGFGSLLIAELVSLVNVYPELEAQLFVFSAGVVLAHIAIIGALYFLYLAVASISRGKKRAAVSRCVRVASRGAWSATAVVAILFIGALFVPAGGPLLWPMLAILVVAGSSASITLRSWSQGLLAKQE